MHLGEGVEVGKQNAVLVLIAGLSVSGCATVGESLQRAESWAKARQEANAQQQDPHALQPQQLDARRSAPSAKATQTTDTQSARPIVGDAYKVLDRYDKHQTLDSGPEGKRVIIHAAYKNGKSPNLIIYAQHKPGWLAVYDQPVSGSTKGLVFSGTSSESEEAPAIDCSVDGKRTTVFGWMRKGTPGRKPNFVATKPELVWTLDGNYQPVAVSGRKVECNYG